MLMIKIGHLARHRTIHKFVHKLLWNRRLLDFPIFVWPAHCEGPGHGQIQIQCLIDGSERNASQYHKQYQHQNENLPFISLLLLVTNELVSIPSFDKCTTMPSVLSIEKLGHTLVA